MKRSQDQTNAMHEDGLLEEVEAELDQLRNLRSANELLAQAKAIVSM